MCVLVMNVSNKSVGEAMGKRSRIHTRCWEEAEAFYH